MRSEPENTRSQQCSHSGAVMTVWCEVWLKKEPPVAARAAVYRKGFIEPLVCQPNITNHVQAEEGWSSKTACGPRWDQSNCTSAFEALALRAAFPEELADLYTSEEMQNRLRTVRAKRSRKSRKRRSTD